MTTYTLTQFKDVLTKFHFINIELLLYLQKNTIKMKNLLLILSLCFLIISCKTENKSPLPANIYEISGSAKGVYNGMRAYIKIVDEKRRTINIDTAIVMNEIYTFKGKVDVPAMRILTVDGIKQNLPFVFESGRTTIDINKDNIFNSKIEGSINNEDYKVYLASYKKKSEALVLIRSELQKARKGNDMVLLAELTAKNNIKKAELLNYAYEFIKDNPNSDFSLLLLESSLVGTQQNIEKLKESLILLKDVVNKNAPYKLKGQKIEAFISLKEAQANLDVGKIAPNFTSTTPNGETLSLNDIKGKATIIDFWAAWCGPCRRENPNVVKVYNKYHKKGLEIISVSLDRAGQKERWLKAIEDDNMNWHHVSDLKYFNDPVAQLYHITSIPATFILDEDGIIVAKRLRGNALERKISEMLD
ncbi:MAG: AhpC/TSA family protein [Bacteroidetes bacterium]|nr:AhpC/TSA family protein [Bacteroidota bacterium]